VSCSEWLCAVAVLRLVSCCVMCVSCHVCVVCVVLLCRVCCLYLLLPINGMICRSPACSRKQFTQVVHIEPGAISIMHKHP
jgi:hypothetical protein